MLITVTHRTRHAFEEPVDYALSRLKLTARNAPGQIVRDWSLTLEGAVREAEYEDAFGNAVTLVRPLEGVRAVSFTAKGTVETEDRHGVYGPHQGHVPLWLYLRETPLTKAGKLIRDLARKAQGDGELNRLHALMAAIADQIAWTPGATDVTTPAETALERKAGVCQDHAHAFISAARLMGIPARYVSGYLVNPDIAGEASHAWAEAFVTGLGWVGFDPANRLCPNDHYVRLASATDYLGSAPVSGMRLGSGAETMSVSVEVGSDGQSQSQGQSQG